MDELQSSAGSSPKQQQKKGRNTEVIKKPKKASLVPKLTKKELNEDLTETF